MELSNVISNVSSASSADGCNVCVCACCSRIPGFSALCTWYVRQSAENPAGPRQQAYTHMSIAALDAASIAQMHMRNKRTTAHQVERFSTHLR